MSFCLLYLMRATPTKRALTFQTTVDDESDADDSSCHALSRSLLASEVGGDGGDKEERYLGATTGSADDLRSIGQSAGSLSSVVRISL